MLAGQVKICTTYDKGEYSTNFCFYLARYSYVEIDFGLQKTDKFINNDMAVQSEIRDTYRATEMFARQISGLSAHGTHSAYSRTPAGATEYMYICVCACMCACACTCVYVYIYIYIKKSLFAKTELFS